MHPRLKSSLRPALIGGAILLAGSLAFAGYRMFGPELLGRIKPSKDGVDGQSAAFDAGGTRSTLAAASREEATAIDTPVDPSTAEFGAAEAASGESSSPSTAESESSATVPMVPVDATRGPEGSGGLEPVLSGAGALIEKGSSLSLGEAPSQDPPRLERYDDDANTVRSLDRTGYRPSFFRGPEVKDQTGREEEIKYVYLSRGAWMIRAWRPYLDRIAVDVIKADSTEVFANFVEVSRTFDYLCLLIASDDGSERMTRKIAKAVSLHRETVSTLRLQWVRKSEKTLALLDEYIEETFLKKLDLKATRIPAGSLSGAQYRSIKDTYKEILEGTEEEAKDAFPATLLNRR